MNKALPAITERPAQLQKRLRAEPDTQKRLRLQALYLLASGQARSRLALALARLLVVHRHTIRAWLTRYEAGGLNALLRIAKAPGKRSALSPQVLRQLQTRLAQRQGFGLLGRRTSRASGLQYRPCPRAL